MGEFFQGWRRKIGLLTLLMACLSMGLWMRSQEFFDMINLNSSRFRIGVGSVDGRIWLIHTTLLDNVGLISRNSGSIKHVIGFRLNDKGIRQPFDPSINSELDWRWEGSGFLFCSGKFGAVQFRNYLIPYWCFITPLTLASAYLLLKKPKALTQRKSAEPISIEGA